MLGSSPSTPMCLTCGLHEDRCQYNSAYLSVDASFYRMDCYGQLALYVFASNNSAMQETSVNNNQSLDVTKTANIGVKCLCEFMSVLFGLGPGLPLYTLMDNRGSGAGTGISFYGLLTYLFILVSVKNNLKNRECVICLLTLSAQKQFSTYLFIYLFF